MKVATKIAKWGSSSAVRLPAEVLKQAGLSNGDEVNVEVTDGAVVLRRVRGREEILKSLEQFRGFIPADHEFDREEANARR